MTGKPDNFRRVQLPPKTTAAKSTPETKMDFTQNMVPVAPTVAVGPTYQKYVQFEELPTDSIRSFLIHANDCYKRSIPLAKKNPPFIVRLENGQGKKRPYAVCIGKFFSPRGTWYYRCIRIPEKLKSNLAQEGLTFGDYEAHMLSLVESELLSKDIVDLLAELKKNDTRINSLPSDGLPIA